MKPEIYKYWQPAAMITIIFVILFLYWQVLDHQFIIFDDDAYIRMNPHVNTGFSFENIVWAFSFSNVTYWHPMTWLSHMLDCQLFGLDPRSHHMVNVLFHILNSTLLYLVIFRMTGAELQSIIVALLFAVHPVNVDTVAWAAERKNLLSTSFWMLTMLIYISYAKTPRISRYLLMLSVYILGLLSKPMLVTLPFVLLLIDYWPLRRFQLAVVDGKSFYGIPWSRNLRYSGISLFRLIGEKGPMLIVSIAAIIISAISVRHGGAQVLTSIVPMGLRIENAMVGYVLYMGKLFFPVDLAFFYPYPHTVPLWQAIASGIILIIITVAALKLSIKAPYVIVGWLWFVGTLVPVSGLMQGGLWPAMADRWAYVPFIGMYILVSWACHDVMQRWQRNKKILFWAVMTAALLSLMVITWKQLSYWKDGETLSRHAILVTKDNYVAYNNLGVALFEKGDLPGAITQLKNSININQQYALSRVNLGKAFFQAKRYDEAMDHFQASLKINPDLWEPHKFIGYYMLLSSDYDDAIKHFHEALKNDGQQPDVYNYIGLSYVYKGNIQSAIRYFEHAAQERPDYGEALRNLKDARDERDKIRNNISRVQETTKGQSENSESYELLGDLYRRLGENDNAISFYKESLSVQPDNIQVMYKLSIAHSDMQDYPRATEWLQKILLLQPDNADVYYNFACIYAKQNQVDESLSWLKKAVEKGFNNWALLRKDPDLKNIRTSMYVRNLLDRH